MYISGPVESFISQYQFDTDTFDLFSYIGTTEQGITINRIQHQRFIQEDLFGDATGDGYNTGIDMQVSGVWIELNTYGVYVIQSTQNDIWGVNDSAGYPLSSLFGQLVITPKPWTPAMYQIGTLAWQYYGGTHSNGYGLSYVFYNCGPINNLDQTLWSGISKMPVTFKCLPYLIPEDGITLDNGVIIGNTVGYPINKIWDIIDTPAPNGNPGAGSCYFG